MNPKLAQINAHIAGMVNDDISSQSIRSILQEHFMQNGQERPAEWLDNYAEFLRSYIQFAPGNLATMWNVANQQGKSAQFEPIAEMLIAYYFKPDDQIPDRLGLWGWLDDAYLSNYTLELINNRCKEQLGYYLLDFDFNKCNNIVSSFLGNNLQALQLEAERTANKTEVWNAVEAFAGALLGGLLLYGLMGEGGNQTSGSSSRSYVADTERRIAQITSGTSLYGY
jgi:uncharacterized membrane protein YkvA (DUF1232 family)